MNNSIASLDAQVESLKTSQANLRQKIELFQARKEELKALYDSSRAQLKVKESASGVSQDMSDAAHAIQRAEGRIQAMQARVDAIDDLVASGALEDVLAPEGDDIDRELASLTRAALVESELERLKAEMVNPRTELIEAETV